MEFLMQIKPELEFLMQIKPELEQMEQRMLNNELLDTLLNAYLAEIEGSDDLVSEIEYRESSEILAATLSEAEKDELRILEGYGRTLLLEAMRFAFRRGIYAGFQHLYDENPPEFLFSELVNCKPYELPAEISCAQHVFQHQSDALEKMVCEARPDPKVYKPLLYHCISISFGWEERQYGVMRHAFYLGYRYALSIIQGIATTSAYRKIIAKTLLIEHELAFTLTLEEREKNQTTCKKHTPPAGCRTSSEQGQPAAPSAAETDEP
ncbi:hypothetical protein D7X33_00865 [Butyricicoccus sp. 1XD8-22]|nr:hypothetical protein D7X33_00865 [Butyricicoccus sp. 1XD8-22]